MNTQTNLFTRSDSCSSYPESKQSDSSCQGKSDFSNKKHKRKYEFKIYPNVVEFTPPKGFPVYRLSKPSPRGNISGFSKKARFRLFHFLAKISTDLQRKPLFFTLTYHFGHFKSNDIHHQHFHNFLTQLRNLDNCAQYIWRIEYQKRGAPHFHIIYFPGPVCDTFFMPRFLGRLSEIWHKISDPNSKAHIKYGFKSVEINDYQHACAYLSKYLAKTDEDHSPDRPGKQYGCSRNLPFSQPRIIHLEETAAHFLLESVRRWLVAKGKKQYQFSEYFNEEHSQVIFIPETLFIAKFHNEKARLQFDEIPQ